MEFGGEGPSFETIVAFSKNGAVPHHKTGETKLQNDMPIMIDMGAKYKGYSSDITRTVLFGHPDKEFVTCYDAVLKANLLAEKNIKCGTTTFVADSFARNHLKEKGFSEESLMELGLISRGKKDPNKYYDRFRSRVMFPSINTRGKIIGFGGRTLGDDEPKYLNSPESTVFLKSP